MKRAKMMSLTLVLTFLLVGYALAEGDLIKPKPQITCPVMRGHIINCGIDKEVYTDYKEKRVYFCYKDCVEEFWKDPEKYIKILEDEGVTLEGAPVQVIRKSPTMEITGKVRLRVAAHNNFLLIT